MLVGQERGFRRTNMRIAGRADPRGRLSAGVGPPGHARWRYPPISPELHAWQLGLALGIVLGPAPMALAFTAMAEGTREGRSLARSWLVLMTAWCALGSAAGILLGAAGAFALGWALLGMGALFAAGLTWLRFIRRGETIPLGELLLLQARPRPGELVALAAAVSLGAGLVLRLTTRLITDYDSLAYHLPTMAQWFQTRSLARLAQFAQMIGLYPYSWEALCALFLLPFHEDYLVAFPNVVAWGVFGLAVYALAEEVGANRAAGAAAALAVLSLPDVLDNVWTAHVDLPLAAFFMAGLVFCLRYLRTRSVGYLGPFLLCLGLAAGVKTSGLVYDALLIAILLAGLAWSAVTRSRSGRFPRGPVSGVVVGALCALVVGGFWYGRNLQEVGNPLAPLTVQIGRRVIFAGATTAPRLLRETTVAGLFDPGDLVDWDILVTEVSEHLGWPFYGMLVLALLGPAGLLGRERPIARVTMAGLFFLVGLTGYLYAVTPYSADNYGHHSLFTAWMGQALRYSCPCCGVLAVAGAAGATAARLPRWLLIGLGAAAAVATLQSRGLGFAVVFAGGLWAALRLVESRSPGPGGRRDANRGLVLLLVCFSLPPLILGSYLARMWRESDVDRAYGPLAKALPALVEPEETIGYLNCYVSYLLYGRDLSRKVVYLPLKGRDPEQWRRYLHAHHIAVVALGSLGVGGPDPQLVRWLKSEDGPMVRVYGNPVVEPTLYRLKKTGSPEEGSGESRPLSASAAFPSGAGPSPAQDSPLHRRNTLPGGEEA